MKYFILAFLLVLALVYTVEDDKPVDEFSDTSNNNPIAYCLRTKNGFNDAQIAAFLREIQNPQKAVALFPYGGKLSKCVQERRKLMKEQEE